MTNVQILALATPVVIVAIAFAYTGYLLAQKPPKRRAASREVLDRLQPVTKPPGNENRHASPDGIVRG